MHQQQTAFENIVGKGEIARNERFVLFPQCFKHNQINVSPFVHIFDIISLFAVELEEPKIGMSGKVLNESCLCKGQQGKMPIFSFFFSTVFSKIFFPRVN